MQLVILAGGKGTRLRERLGPLPKPLIDICGLPLLERQILLARKHGFTKALILVNHAADYIRAFCEEKRNWGLNVDCIDDGEPRGTAGATLACFDRLAPEFLVMYGDTMLEVDLRGFHTFHRQVEDTAATLYLHPNDHPQDSDLVEMDDDGQVTAFHASPHDPARYYPNLVNAALYWVRREALRPWRHEEGMLDFAGDLFPMMLQRGSRLRGFNGIEYIKDIGTPDRLDKICAAFQSGKIGRASLEQAQPIVFLDRDGTINREVDHLHAADQFELLPGVEGAIQRLNQSDYRSCVITNQPVIARGECSYAELRQIHNKMETLLGRQGAFLDRIYFCPHHPDRGFPGERPELKVPCACRKPNTGMIDRALLELHGARETCWVIGDSSVDIETARRAGIRSILVETGYAGLDYREWATPDAILPDLPAAVTFVLETYPRLRSLCDALVDGIGDGAVVLIGGLSRSGKSTFAAVLRDALLARGHSAVILAADRWLLDEPERTDGVLGRYDMPALQSLLNQLADCERRPDGLALPGYHKLLRKRVQSVSHLPLTRADVIILEGTIALALDTGGAVDVRRLHVEIDENMRRQRVFDEYRLRGFSEESAREVYWARQSDESPVVEQLAQGAARIALGGISLGEALT
jgi:histidinol-phosphate phosphatase family protein